MTHTKSYPCEKHDTNFLMSFDDSLLKNDSKSDGSPTMFLENAVEIPWLELVQNPCHVLAWKTNKTCIKEIEFGMDLDQTAVDLRHEMAWNSYENPCHIFYIDNR